MKNTALIRHEITDRALMLLEVWDDQIAERLAGGPVPDSVRDAVEEVLFFMNRAVNELSTWEDAANEPEGKA